MVDFCELSLKSSLFLEVSRMSSLLDLPIPCGWEKYYNDLKPSPFGANEHSRAEPIRSSLTRDLRVSSTGTGPCFHRRLVRKEGP